MLCTVYKLRNFDRKLTEEEVMATACVADFTFDPHPSGRDEMVASINRPNGAPFLQLERASLRVRKGGIIVEGSETFPAGQFAIQRWWCVPAPGGVADEMDLVASRLLSH